MNINQRKAKKVLWNLFCSATPAKFSLFTSAEYNEFISQGYLLSQFSEPHEYTTFLTVQEKVLYILFIYEAFPDIST